MNDIRMLLLQEKAKVLGRIIDLCVLLLDKIDQESLLVYYGMKSDTRDNATTIKT